MSIKKYQFKLNTGRHPFNLPLVSSGNSIPKIIYQTYKSWSDLKSEWRENINHIRELNPTWSYRFFDDKAVEDFILNEYGVKILDV